MMKSSTIFTDYLKEGVTPLFGLSLGTVFLIVGFMVIPLNPTSPINIGAIFLLSGIAIYLGRPLFLKLYALYDFVILPKRTVIIGRKYMTKLLNTKKKGYKLFMAEVKKLLPTTGGLVTAHYGQVIWKLSGPVKESQKILSHDYIERSIEISFYSSEEAAIQRVRIVNSLLDPEEKTILLDVGEFWIEMMTSSFDFLNINHTMSLKEYESRLCSYLVISFKDTFVGKATIVVVCTKM